MTYINLDIRILHTLMYQVDLCYTDKNENENKNINQTKSESESENEKENIDESENYNIKNDNKTTVRKSFSFNDMFNYFFF